MMFRDAMTIVQSQLNTMFAFHVDKKSLDDLLPSVAERYMESYRKITPLIDNPHMGSQYFDHSNDSKYAMFLWFLSNEVWFQYEDGYTANFIQALNKALHGCHLPYDALMPDIFYLPHTQGIVVARKVMLKNYLCLYHNTTIGRVGDKYPSFGGPLIMYPNSGVTGKSMIGGKTVISYGQHISDDNILLVGMGFREDLFDFHFKGWKDE